MPLYEFQCEQCHHECEMLVRSASSAVSGLECPHCGSDKLTKKWSTFASTTAGGANPTSPREAACTGVPRSCGLCGTGKPHSH